MYLAPSVGAVNQENCDTTVAVVLAPILMALMNSWVVTDPVGLLDVMIAGDHDKRLAPWKPSAAQQKRPTPAWVDPQVDVTGQWVCRGTTLRIQKQDGVYKVDFETRGCTANWRLKRTATYSKGVLLLDLPVDPYADDIFNKLYAGRGSDTDFLLPSCTVLWGAFPLSETGFRRYNPEPSPPSL